MPLIRRREFMQTSLGTATLWTLTPAVPQFLAHAAEDNKTKRGDNVLVVVQLSGGNDGLNTVVPYADDEYYKNRFTLAQGRNQVLKINDYVGFHPSMSGFAELLEAGRLSILQGIGYPNPDRSHFSSMDIWHSARREEDRRSEGWLGRYLDDNNRQDGRDVPALHLGNGRQPLAVVGQDVRAASVRSMSGFKLDVGNDTALRNTIETAANAPRKDQDDLAAFLQQSTSAALASSRRVQESLGNYKTPVAYPGSSLAQQLRTVAQLIDAGLSTRIYYLTLDGFDTHSDQAGAHAALVAQLSAACNAFVQDLDAHGHLDRVLLMSFSEFGRRVKENASAGTDHGAAAPLFLAGGKVRPGLHGKHPSLTDLDDGDLKHHTDFRRVYATVLEKWLGCQSEPILGQRYEPLDVLRA